MLLRGEIGLNSRKTSEKGQLNQEQLKQILLRAYMRGENLTNISPQDIINELTRSLRKISSD